MRQPIDGWVLVDYEHEDSPFVYHSTGPSSIYFNEREGFASFEIHDPIDGQSSTYQIPVNVLRAWVNAFDKWKSQDDQQ